MNKSMPVRLAKIEVVFLDEHQGWTTEIVEIPEDVVAIESQDAFIKWAYSDAGAKFRESWDKMVIAVYVMSWRGDLQAQDHPALAEEPEVLFGRDMEGVWYRFERTEDLNETVSAVFQVWEQGVRDVSMDGDEGLLSLMLYTEAEAQAQAERLDTEFEAVGHRGGNFDELDSLRSALSGEGGG